ncbi:MAG: DUF2813 domain-containing protein [Acidobacteriota bacterium]|nr:MAG: DUF2813 domain-containing protein [Acidobacteriota bacterium]
MRSIHIQNYRAIRDGSIHLDETTLLIGENDSGRTSIMEALVLILGVPEERFETALKPVHFHRQPDGTTGPLRIRLQVRENRPGCWNPPVEIETHLPATKQGIRQFDFEFEAQLDSTEGSIRQGWSLREDSRSPRRLVGSPELLEWVRELVPVLWLRFGVTNPISPSARAAGPPDDPLLDELVLRYWNLITGNVANLAAELEQGAAVAAKVIEKYKRHFAGAAPVMGAMAAEIIRPKASSVNRVARGVGSSAQKIGMLLLLGSVLQMVRQRFSPEAHPVLVLDNPESNLHPMTLASVWRLLERVTLQKVVSTNSSLLLANVSLSRMRRLTRRGGHVTEWSVGPSIMEPDELRRVDYHVRSRRASAMFARCWLLIEGETEFWVMPELAHILGYDFGELGIVTVEFAQAGVAPLIKLADSLGIAWQLIADGDVAGERFAAAARKVAGRGERSHKTAGIIRLPSSDMETCFWENGFDDVISRIAYPNGSRGRQTAARVIDKAIEKTSKPYLALSLIEAAVERGPDRIPPLLRKAIEACVRMSVTAHDAS